MSSIVHPTLTAWERDEHEGHYQADLFGWRLKVRWEPNGGEGRGAFRWQAVQEGALADGKEPFEEMELAMSEAETFARKDARRKALWAAYQAEMAARGEK